MAAARAFLRDCAAANAPTLLVPDKDADGLCGGMIIYRTLSALGLHQDNIHVHFVAKGSNVHNEAERERMEKYDTQFAIVVDQGSRRSGPIVRSAQDKTQIMRTLIVNHHWSDAFPDGATVCFSYC